MNGRHTMKNCFHFLFIILLTAPLFFFSCEKKETVTSRKKYTYFTTSTAPQTWSPTDWQMGNEGNIMSFTQSGLYEFVLNKKKNNSEVVCEMASAFPVDVTKEYAGKKPYGVPSDAENGYAWKISLNKKACWEDGTPITADSWIYTFQQFLNPEMKNYRASTLYEGTFAVANAKTYYEGDGEKKPKVNWNNVGFVKNDDYTLIFILEKPTTLFYTEYSLSGISLVKQDLYEAGKKKTGNIIKSSYGTSKESYESYGPYKIVSYQPEKEITFEKNDKWYGYTDGRHTGLYMATGINIQFIDKQSTILALFLQGKLDDTALTVDDMPAYGNSDYIIYNPTSYTTKFSFNSDYKTLKAEETKGINHTLLSYKDFRHAVSLCIDRQAFSKTCFAGSVPGYGLINKIYISNPDTNEYYRDSKQAVEALCTFYGTKTEKDITGYNRDEAKKLFQNAYNQALKDGNIESSDKVQIDFHTYNADPIMMRRVTFLQDAINAATEGTVLSGRVVIKQITDENYYANMEKGNCDLALTQWGGSSYDPYSVLWCYSTSEAKLEYGFNPDKETLTITLSGKNSTKTYHEWYTALCAGEYVTADSDTRNTILAANEKGLLSYYDKIPVCYYRTASLDSQRIIEGSPEFINSLVGHGGIRSLTFTMDDDKWNAYCKKNNNQLSY
jgi:oligopeptide transport system substrate-binding protein